MRRRFRGHQLLPVEMRRRCRDETALQRTKALPVEIIRLRAVHTYVCAQGGGPRQRWWPCLHSDLRAAFAPLFTACTRVPLFTCAPLYLCTRVPLFTCALCTAVYRVHFFVLPLHFCDIFRRQLLFYCVTSRVHFMHGALCGVRRGNHVAHDAVEHALVRESLCGQHRVDLNGKKASGAKKHVAFTCRK